MMMTMRVFAIVLVSVVLSLSFASTANAQASDAQRPRIAVGQPFPDLPFPSLTDGKLTSVSAFRGKKTILHVFASW